jgi:O-antigen/teichoic acid export membrane protein
MTTNQRTRSSRPSKGAVRGHLSRVFGFALLPAFSFLASLVILPIISARFGPAAWSMVALGQSTGAIASIVVGLTWPIEGGNLVAGLRPEERGAVYVRSVASQFIVFVLAGAVSSVVTYALAPTYRWEAVVFSLANTAGGFTAAWYFSGVGTPRPLLINEGLMRMLGYVAALVAILAGGGLMWYATTTLGAALVSIALNWWTIVVRKHVHIPRTIARDAWRTVREEWFGTLARLIQSVYSFGGPSLFALLHPAGLAAYAGSRTVQVTAANALSAVPNAFVSWVGSQRGERLRHRIRDTNRLMAVSAVLIFAGVAVFGQLVLDYLFAHKLVLALDDRVLLAAAIALSFYNRSYQLLVLVPLGRKSLVYSTTMVSSIFGLVAYCVLIPVFGVTGGLLVPPVVFIGLQIRYRIAMMRTPPAVPVEG